MISISLTDIRNIKADVKLPKEVISHINQYKDKHARYISDFAWRLLISEIKRNINIDLNNEKVLFDKNGKPYLESGSIYFNISHSNNMVAVCFSNVPCSVDIEQLIPLDMCETLSKRILSNQQLKAYQASKNKQDYLTQIWVKKEAYVKNNNLSILDIDKLKNIKTGSMRTYRMCDVDGNKYYYAFLNKIDA